MFFFFGPAKNSPEKSAQIERDREKREATMAAPARPLREAARLSQARSKQVLQLYLNSSSSEEDQMNSIAAQKITKVVTSDEEYEFSDDRTNTDNAETDGTTTTEDTLSSDPTVHTSDLTSGRTESTYTSRSSKRRVFSVETDEESFLKDGESVETLSTNGSNHPDQPVAEQDVIDLTDPVANAKRILAANIQTNDDYERAFYSYMTMKKFPRSPAVFGESIAPVVVLLLTDHAEGFQEEVRKFVAQYEAFDGDAEATWLSDYLWSQLPQDSEQVAGEFSSYIAHALALLRSFLNGFTLPSHAGVSAEEFAKLVVFAFVSGALPDATFFLGYHEKKSA